MVLPDDFNKIFGSTATGGITPINDVNYAKGWEFAGANPPTKNDFSYLQNLSDLKSQWLFNNNNGRLLNVQVFSVSGYYTPTPGTKFIIVETQGGGGAGGGASATGAGQFSVGAGGTAGTYAVSKFDTGFSDGVTVTVGTNGTPVAGATGGNGGASSFGGLVSCPGGGGGGLITASAPGNGPVGSPLGSSATGSFIYNIPGQSGGHCFTVSTASIAGPGGSSRMGMGAPINVLNTNGYNGSGRGSGGSGGANQSSQGVRTGGAGTPGIVIVWEYA